MPLLRMVTGKPLLNEAFWQGFHADCFAAGLAQLKKHVEREDKVAKFWLDPVRLQRSGGFNRSEIRNIHKIINDNHSKLLEAWNEYFGH
jgi:hypothetical protein